MGKQKHSWNMNQRYVRSGEAVWREAGNDTKRHTKHQSANFVHTKWHWRVHCVISKEIPLDFNCFCQIWQQKEKHNRQVVNKPQITIKQLMWWLLSSNGNSAFVKCEYLVYVCKWWSVNISGCWTVCWRKRVIWRRQLGFWGNCDGIFPQQWVDWSGKKNPIDNRNQDMIKL